MAIGAGDRTIRRGGFSPPDAKAPGAHGVGRLKPALQIGARPIGESAASRPADPLRARTRSYALAVGAAESSITRYAWLRWGAGAAAHGDPAMIRGERHG
jgi:hypothetical protein